MKVNISISLSKEIAERLNKYCLENKVSKSGLIEKLVALYLDNNIITVDEIYKNFIETYLELFEEMHKELAEKLKELKLFRIEIIAPIPSPIHLAILPHSEFALPDPIYSKFKDHVTPLLRFCNKIYSSIIERKRIVVEKEIIKTLEIMFPKLKGSVIYQALRRFYFKEENVIKIDGKTLKEVCKILYEYTESLL